jgi:HlyD family secretion protein
MNSLAIPATSSRKGVILASAVFAALLIGAGVFKYVNNAPETTSVAAGSVYEPAAMRDLDVKIVKDGELQAVDNIDIYCQVEGQTTILSLVKEGASVKKGDVLMTLDSSAIKQKIEDTTLDFEKAQADLTTAREMLEIQKSQNAANVDASQVTLTLAKLDLRRYVEGDYPEKLQSARDTADMADISLKNATEKQQQTLDLLNKGFVTQADMESARVDVTKAKIASDQAHKDLENLEKYANESDLTTKKSAVLQAEQALVRVQRENTANLAQKEADLHAKEQTVAIQKRRLDKYNDQLAACTIAAPADGLVVYASSQDRNSQAPFTEGSQVRERQLMLRLPDTSGMKAVIRVPEAQISKLKEGERASIKIVGHTKAVGGTVAKISVLADNSQRWWNPDLKEYPVDITLDETPTDVKPGQSVLADVYVTRLNQVLSVPLTSLYASGTETYVFMRGDPSPMPKKVKIGAVNETHAEIVDGLTPGDEVLILQQGQGRQLLEAAGIKEQPTTRPSDLDRKDGGKKTGSGERGVIGAPVNSDKMKKIKVGA